jgi:hypothetical protein
MPNPSTPETPGSIIKIDEYQWAITDNTVDIELQENQNADCFTLYQHDGISENADLIHVCNWPALKKAIDDFQAMRGGKI